MSEIVLHIPYITVNEVTLLVVHLTGAFEAEASLNTSPAKHAFSRFPFTGKSTPHIPFTRTFSAADFTTVELTLVALQPDRNIADVPVNPAKLMTPAAPPFVPSKNTLLRNKYGSLADVDAVLIGAAPLLFV